MTESKDKVRGRCSVNHIIKFGKRIHVITLQKDKYYFSNGLTKINGKLDISMLYYIQDIPACCIIRFIIIIIQVYILPVLGWEPGINQYDKCAGEPGRTKPYASINHLGLCGKTNVFVYDEGECSVYDVPNNPDQPPQGKVETQQTQNICITFYGVGSTSKTLGRRCTAVIQMFCVCWEDIDAIIITSLYLEAVTSRLKKIFYQ